MIRPIRAAVLLFSSIMLFNALATAQDGMVFDFYNDDVFDPDIYSAEWNIEDGEIRIQLAMIEAVRVGTEGW